MVHFSTSACNYLDCEFTSAFFDENHYVKHPMECATPAFDTIMETQNLDGRTKFILMALIGRLFFSSNFLDKWEVVPYLKGIAGTGKSTLAAIISNFLDPQDVAIIANNCESTFGMMSLPDKYAWVAPEVKSDFTLNQAQFQSLAVKPNQTGCRRRSLHERGSERNGIDSLLSLSPRMRMRERERERERERLIV
jgi:hypothetical protein